MKCNYAMGFKLAAGLMGPLASFNGARFGLDLVPVSEQVQRLNQFAVLRAIIVWPHFY